MTISNSCFWITIRRRSENYTIGYKTSYKFITSPINIGVNEINWNSLTYETFSGNSGVPNENFKIIDKFYSNKYVLIGGNIYDIYTGNKSSITGNLLDKYGNIVEINFNSHFYDTYADIKLNAINLNNNYLYCHFSYQNGEYEKIERYDINNNYNYVDFINIDKKINYVTTSNYAVAHHKLYTYNDNSFLLSFSDSFVEGGFVKYEVDGSIDKNFAINYASTCDKKYSTNWGPEETIASFDIDNNGNFYVLYRGSQTSIQASIYNKNKLLSNYYLEKYDNTGKTIDKVHIDIGDGINNLSESVKIAVDATGSYIYFADIGNYKIKLLSNNPNFDLK